MPPPPAMTPHPQMDAGGTTTEDERNIAMVNHIAAIFFWVLGPIIIFLLKGKESKFVAHHCLQSLHWAILEFAAYFIVAALAAITCGFGGILFPVLWLGLVLIRVMAAIKAKNGEWYRFPISGNWTFLNSLFK